MLIPSSLICVSGRTENCIKIIITPALAVDQLGYRIGYGKGFYDRYLNKFLRKSKNILTVGVAFSFQKYHKLPINRNDVRLDLILTKKGIY